MRIFSMDDQWCNENRIRLLESRMMRKYQVRFGGGQTKKELLGHLVGWLPTFSKYSHGFRPGCGCHTALREIKKWDGTTWFIEGDISKCFDNVHHEILLNCLAERIADRRLLKLITSFLKAGLMENRLFQHSDLGVPQGGICTPPTMLQKRC